MEVSYEFKWNPITKKGLERIPDDILYSIAVQTLDLSYPMIPKDSKKMAISSKAGGVKGGNGDFYIGSYTNYAKYVWKMPQGKTNWTTPGTSNKWFARGLKKYGSTIINNAINQSWKKDM